MKLKVYSTSILRTRNSSLVEFIADVEINFISQNITCSSDKSGQIELICNATSSPIPNLVWTYNGQVLAATSTSESNSMHQIIGSSIVQNTTDKRFVDPMRTSFFIENQHVNSIQLKMTVENCSIGVQRFDCIAFNDFSKDQQSAHVIGVLKPTFSIPTNETLKSLAEGSSTTIDCDVIGYPKPSIVWFKVSAFLRCFWHTNLFLLSITNF